jgi:hypothetical protein
MIVVRLVVGLVLCHVVVCMLDMATQIEMEQATLDVLGSPSESDSYIVSMPPLPS